MPLSTSLRNEILDLVARSDHYVSLHTGDPGSSGANEVSGNRYGRANLGKTPAPKDGFKATDREIIHLDLPKCRVTHVGLWDSERGGNFRVGGQLGKPIDVVEGDSVRFRAAKLAFAVSDGAE